MTPKALSREIKFRAYGTEYGGGEIKMRYSDESPDIPCFWTLYVGNKQEYAEAIMQYTGLHDKNGKEIYEGDILEYDDKNGLTESFIETVKWIDNGYTCGFGTESSEQVWAEVARLSEIVGNIYQNPELLK